MNSVGIGTTNPTSKLDVNGNTWLGLIHPLIQCPMTPDTSLVHLVRFNQKRWSGGTSIFCPCSIREIYYNYPDDIRIIKERCVLYKNGIGTTDPNSAKLDVRGTIRHTGVTTMVPGAFDVNSIVGERPLQVNYKLLSTSLRTGFLVKNAFDFRTDNTFNSAFMVLDPYDSSNSTFAFRVAVGATLSIPLG